MKRVNKPWGHELIWAHTPHYVGKILHIREGHKLSRQFHVKKEETILVLQGNLVLETGEGDSVRTTILEPQQSYHIPPRTIHRFCATAGGDVRLVEASTPELDDVVRLQDDYDRRTAQDVPIIPPNLDYDDS